MVDTPYQVVWRGIVHDSTGYSRASREYLLALDRQGVDIKIEPMNFGTPPTQLAEEQANRLRELIDKPYATDKPKVLIYHAQPNGINADFERQQYDYVIVNTVWETTKVPLNWFPTANRVDAMIVPSTMNVEALKDSGVTAPIYMVPHGADTDRFKPENKPTDLPMANGKYTFLSVFQWQHRKAPEVLLRAFWEEFTSSDPVALIVKTYFGGSRETGRQVRAAIGAMKNEFVGDKDTAPILVTTSNFSDEDMKGLYTLADCFVLPSRGEGVGLPYVEALSSGIPVIATAWGGQTDFLKDNSNSLLIKCGLENTRARLNPFVPDFHGLFTDDMRWAEPSVSDLRLHLRYAFENQSHMKSMGEQGRKDMLNMSWDNAGVIFKKAIEEVIANANES